MVQGSPLSRRPSASKWRSPPPIGQGLAVIAIVALVVILSAIGIVGYLFSLRIAAARTEVVRIEQRTDERRAEVQALRRDYEIRSRFGELDRWRTPLDLQPMAAGQLAGGAADIARTAAERRQALANAQAEARLVDASAKPGYPAAAREKLDDLIGAVAAR